MAPPLPSGPAAPQRLPAGALMDDVRALAAPEMEGRRTATEGGRRARALVVSRFRELGLQEVGGSYLHPFSFEHVSIRAIWRRDRPVRMHVTGAANVLGLVPGREPGAPHLVVSAHYDHLGVRDGVLYPGADDNASGVAVLLALARHLRSHPPRHPVLFAALDAEEMGLRGAEALVAKPPVPLDRVALLLNLDMVSRSDERAIVASGTYPNPQLEPLVRRAAARSPVRVRLGHDRPRWLAGSVDDWTDQSDQGPFHDAGVPFLYLGVEDHEDYHAPGDRPERIDPAFLHAVGELVLDVLLEADEGGALR